MPITPKRLQTVYINIVNLNIVIYDNTEIKDTVMVFNIGITVKADNIQ
jgi:hypothetical protein